MAEISMGYMTVSMDVVDEGFNLACWMSTVDFWMSEQVQFPFKYTHMGDNCTWVLHCNRELTNKAIAMVAEQADAICKRQQAINERRKIANR